MFGGDDFKFSRGPRRYAPAFDLDRGNCFLKLRRVRLQPNLRRFIFSSECIPADINHFSDHPNAIAHRVNASALPMRPLYRYLFYPQIKCSSEKKNLRIESPTLDLLHREDDINCAPVEGLESTLTISIMQAQNDSQRQIENSSKTLTTQWLSCGLKFRSKPSRPNCNIGSLFNSRKKFWCLFDGRRQIGVAEEQYLSLRVQHSVANAIAFAAIARIIYQTHHWITNALQPYNFRSVIGRAVVHNDYFGVPALFTDKSEDSLQSLANAYAFVIRGKHDAVCEFQVAMRFLGLRVTPTWGTVCYSNENRAINIQKSPENDRLRRVPELFDPVT